jgi:hypothetical protein
MRNADVVKAANGREHERIVYPETCHSISLNPLEGQQARLSEIAQKKRGEPALSPPVEMGIRKM